MVALRGNVFTGSVYSEWKKECQMWRLILKVIRCAEKDREGAGGLVISPKNIWTIAIWKLAILIKIELSNSFNKVTF